MKHYPDLGEGDNTLGFDFEYIDTTGALGDPGLHYMFEIKGQSAEWKRVLFMSSNEYNCCVRAHKERERKRYVVVVVCLHPEPARIMFWLEDPEMMRMEGHLEMRPDGYTVHMRTRAVFEQSRVK